MPYTILEISEVLNVDPKTVRRWLDTGLRPVPDGKHPIFISGSELKEFLKNKDSKKKVTLERHEFYCFRCKAARRAKRESIKVLAGKKVGVCSACSAKMSRTIKPYQKRLRSPPSPGLNVQNPYQLKLL